MLLYLWCVRKPTRRRCALDEPEPADIVQLNAASLPGRPGHAGPAARLLKLHGAAMPYLKLIKLLYLADRQALLELGRPISCDLFVSMPHGPSV